MKDRSIADEPLFVNPPVLHFIFESAIPRRDFWVFQHDVVIISILRLDVSIPRRDFWVFQLQRTAFERTNGIYCEFQSLEGIFGFFNDSDSPDKAMRSAMFQSLEGIFGFFNLKKHLLQSVQTQCFNP